MAQQFQMSLSHSPSNEAVFLIFRWVMLCLDRAKILKTREDHGLLRSPLMGMGIARVEQLGKKQVPKQEPKTLTFSLQKMELLFLWASLS